MEFRRVHIFCVLLLVVYIEICYSSRVNHPKKPFRHFKRGVKNSLKQITADISTLFQSVENLNKTIMTKSQVCVNDRQELVDCIGNHDVALHSGNHDEIKECLTKYDALSKEFESEKQRNQRMRNNIEILEKRILKNRKDLEEYVDREIRERMKKIKPNLKVNSPQTCETVRRSGVYDLYLESLRVEKSVYCDADTDGGDWIVTMRRQDGSIDFNRTWMEYKNGFGAADGEFWIGNEILHALTNSRPMELRIDMEDYLGKKRYAKYDHFEIGSEEDRYNITVTGYSGTAGNSLKYHNGMKFATMEPEMSEWPYLDCAYRYSAGWWYTDCFQSVLTGVYSRVGEIRQSHGIIWYTLTRWDRALKFVEMKIR